MTTVHESITINAKREQIRPFLYDPEQLLARETAVYRYQPDENWPAVGTQAEVGFTSRGMWTVEPAEGGSRVTLSGDVEPNLFMNLLSKIGITNVEKAQSDVLHALKQKLESG